MWALVESGSVTAVYTRPKAITIGGIQHPRSIFTRWSAAELQAIGIYSYSEEGASVDSRFYKQGGSSVVVDDAAGTVTKTYTHMLKKHLKIQINKFSQQTMMMLQSILMLMVLKFFKQT